MFLSIAFVILCCQAASHAYKTYLKKKPGN